MDSIVLAQDTAGLQHDNFWTDDRFPHFEAERQLIEAVRRADLNLAMMIGMVFSCAPSASFQEYD